MQWSDLVRTFLCDQNVDLTQVYNNFISHLVSEDQMSKTDQVPTSNIGPSPSFLQKSD